MRRFPADKYVLFEQGGNRYATTIFVLVSAVQKVSRCTRIPEGTMLYRGLGGLIDLPDKFHNVDEQGRSGYLDWGMMSTSSDRDVALGYSGVKQRRPRAMVMVIEAAAVDRGADISEFSQYPGEKEFLWLPCSFVQRAQQTGGGRVQVVDGGLVTFVPVRVNLNLKTETVEELLQKKKSMHVTGFEFRVNELRQRLQDEARAGNAKARLKRDKDSQGRFWKREHSVEGYIEAQVDKVVDVLKRHCACAAADYSDDDVYRSLVAESLEVASMAQSALRWWLRDANWSIHNIEYKPLLDCHRNLESFLRQRYVCATSDEERRVAAVELCKMRRLMSWDVEEKDGNGEAPLVALAARGGSGEDAELLVAAGADFAATQANDRSAMYFAAQQGHVEVIRSLVGVGANCNQKNRIGATPLWVASLNGHLGSVQALLEAGADVNMSTTKDSRSPLYVASEKGYGSIVEALLGRGADVNQASTDTGSTPLHLACQKGNGSIVEALLGRGADVNKAKSSGGATPLIIACRKGDGGIVDALLARGADVNQAATDDGTTPLLIACQKGHGSIVEALLGRGADVNKARTDIGATPLYLACQKGDGSIVEALLDRGADVNQATTDDGATPLFIACQEGHGSIVEALLGRGADVNKARTDIGVTPLYVSNQEGHTDIAKILQSAVAAEHAAAIELHRTAGSVVVNRHRGGGCVTSDYLLQFESRGFNTFVADVRLCGGGFYLELQVVAIVGEPQFGFCTREFDSREDARWEGVGDDAWSWAVDGVRQLKWHGGSESAYGCKWSVGDVIGLALDMRTAGVAVMSVSVNGSFAAPNGPAFTDMRAMHLSPAFSGDGRYRVNFGERPFVHAPPDAEYVSVHAFHRQQQ